MEININKYEYLVKNINDIFKRKDTKDYIYINNYIENKKLCNKNYNINSFFKFLKEGFSVNKHIIYNLKIS